MPPSKFNKHLKINVLQKRTDQAAAKGNASLPAGMKNDTKTRQDSEKKYISSMANRLNTIHLKLKRFIR